MTAPSRSRRQRAHETETTVAAYLRDHGWPYAEPVGAGRNGADITGTPGLLCEVKAERGWRPTTWLTQHKQLGIDIDRTPKARPVAHIFVVARPDGYGPERIGAWPVIMRLDSFTALLREAGYGDQL